MNAGYEIATLSAEDVERLQHVYRELTVLAESQVPAVRAAARAAVAHVAQALNGEGLAYELYTSRWDD